MSTLRITPSGTIPVFTWTTKPVATGYAAGSLIFISDVGVNGSTWVSNGTKWVHESALPMLSGGVPVIIPSSGTIGDNGALSGLTALPLTFTSVYLYFPANAISAGSAAGLYYCVMSSTTAGTIYNNTYTSGTPTVPDSPTAFVTTGPGVYTQTTGANITLLSKTIPGGLLGKYGAVKARATFLNATTAGSKTGSFFLGATAFMIGTLTSQAAVDILKNIANAGAENKQTYQYSQITGSGSAVAVAYGAIDTSADTTVSVTGQLAVATDFYGVSMPVIEVIPT